MKLLNTLRNQGYKILQKGNVWKIINYLPSVSPSSALNTWSEDKIFGVG